MARTFGGGYLAGSLIVYIGRPFHGPAHLVQPGTVMSRPVRTVIVGGGIAGILLATRQAAITRIRTKRVTQMDSSQTDVWKPVLIRPR